MAYVIVLFGSLLGIALILGLRLLLRQRSVRRFVRSIHQRLQFAEQNAAPHTVESMTPRPQRSPRASAIELQQVRSLLRTAEKAQAQGNTDEAERLYIQALTIQPKAVDVRAQLAKLYLTTDRASKAEALYRDLLQQRDEVSFHANLGLAYYQQGKFVDACYCYQEALNRDPKNPERSAALGRACIAAKRFEEAAPLLEKACQFLSRDTQLLHLLAECYLQLQDTERAEGAYRRINKLEPYDEAVKAKLVSMTAKG
jgi:Flp pilus assembly protein TadD